MEQKLREWVEGQVAAVHPTLGDTCYLEFKVGGEWRRVVYRTFVSGGVRREGEVFPILCDTKERAVEIFKLAILTYLKTFPVEKSKKLYWRRYPKFVEANVDSHTYWSILARLEVAEY